MTDLTIGYCHREEVNAFFAESIRVVAASMPVRWCTQFSGPMVDKARNAIVEKFLATKSEYLLFVDTDMIFTPRMVVDLMAKASEDRIIGGLCLAVDGTPTARVRKDGMWYPIKPTPDVMAVDYTGAAFTVAHRDIYEKMKPHYSEARPWYAFTERDGQSSGEDAEFCRRASELGFHVLVDGSIRPGHRKGCTIGGEV